MLGFGIHRKLNVSRLLKPCSRWGWNSQPRHCSAAYCLISTAHWPIAPLELLTLKHFTKHYCLWVVIFQFIPWTFLKLITTIWCFMLGFGLHRKWNVSRLLKPCSRWGWNSQPRHCSAAYCLISTTRWPIAPLELLTPQHFSKHYGLCVVIFQCIPWNFLKMITAIWCFMLGFGLHRKLNVSRLLKPCSRWGSNSQPRHCSAAYCLKSTARWPMSPLELLTQTHFTKHYGLCVVIFQFIQWTFLKLITAIWCFMLGFGLLRKLNVSRLLKLCSMWGSNSQPQHCSAAYCLICTTRWTIAPLELLTQKHFTKHYGLCVVIFQCIPWNFLKLIT